MTSPVPADLEPQPGALDAFARIARPYAMFIHIPYYVDDAGAVWLERLWHRDLVEHLSYLTDFILCAPRLQKGSEPDLVRLDAPEGVRLRFVPLPRRKTRFQAMRGLPGTILAVWRAAGLAEVVHTGVGGWPYPLGWISVPAALLRRRKLVVGVESSWHHGFPGGETFATRVYDAVADRFARFACGRADASFYTQEAYRKTLHGGARGAAFVNPAVWINDADLVDDATAEASWREKRSGPLRLLFAGRIIASKGVDVLLAALRILEARGVPVQVDVVGSGDRRPACETAAAELRSVSLHLMDPVPYGEPFFRIVRGHHAVLVPSLADEQPRIVFDANAQAVPVIASDTDGLRPHVAVGRTGWLIPASDETALAAAIERAAASVPALEEMGRAALAAARTVTHRGMHCARSQFLARHLAAEDPVRARQPAADAPPPPKLTQPDADRPAPGPPRDARRELRE